MNRININNYFIEKQITKNVNECLKDKGYVGDELLIKGIDIKSYEYASNLQNKSLLIFLTSKNQYKN